MPVFAVLTESEADDKIIEAKVRDKFTENHYLIGPRQWLIDTNDTAKAVSEALGKDAGDDITYVVFKIDSYSGHHYQDLWDWLDLPRSDDDRKTNIS